MQQLIALSHTQVANEDQQTVNARDLHAFLEVKTDFSDWAKSRIEKYDFIENEDYLLLKFKEQVPHQGGLRSVEKTDYIITLDMAKELSMVEANAQGKAARKYFIACEKKMKCLQVQALTKTQALLTTEKERNAEVKDRIKYLERKKAMYIDGHQMALAKASAEIDRQARYEAEGKLLDLARYEDTTKGYKSELKARVSFVKTQAHIVLKRVAMIEQILKGTEQESDLAFIMNLEGIKSDLGFAKHW